MKIFYIGCVVATSLVVFFNGCSGSTPSAPTYENSTTLEIFNQKLLHPKELQQADTVKQKMFRAEYEDKSYTYNRDKQRDIVKTDDYEMLNFNEFIYVKHITFMYNECQNTDVARSVGNVVGNTILSPLMLLGARSANVSFPYRTLRVQDYALKETLESDSDNVLGCEFEFKYSGFTNHLKVNFEEIDGLRYVDKDVLKYRNFKNYYNVSYIDAQNILNVVDYNLKKREDAALNEKLVEEIAKLKEQKMFATLKQNRGVYKLPKYSLLDLPFDADFVFMAKSGHLMLLDGFYQNINGKKKSLLNSQEHLVNVDNKSVIEKVELEKPKSSVAYSGNGGTLKAFEETSKSQKVLKSLDLIRREKQEALAKEAELREIERAKQEKIEKNFAKKSEIQEVARKEIKVKVDEDGTGFFNSLKEDNAKPVSIE